jgi:hypothetical protein
VTGDHEHDGVHYFLIRQPQGGSFQVPGWMFDRKRGAAALPFLFFGGLTPTLTVTSGANNLTITASQPGFTMLMTIWGAALNAPSASTKIPF